MKKIVALVLVAALSILATGCTTRTTYYRVNTIESTRVRDDKCPRRRPVHGMYCDSEEKTEGTGALILLGMGAVILGAMALGAVGEGIRSGGSGHSGY